MIRLGYVMLPEPEGLVYPVNGGCLAPARVTSSETPAHSSVVGLLLPGSDFGAASARRNLRTQAYLHLGDGGIMIGNPSQEKMSQKVLFRLTG